MAKSRRREKESKIMPQIKITDRIFYIPSCEKPLSADVGIVRGDKRVYLFDAGSTPETLEFLHSLNGNCDIVVSHFHGDHTWWLTGHKKGDEGMEEGDELSLTYERPRFGRIYVGSYTSRYIPDGEVISTPTVISHRPGQGTDADKSAGISGTSDLYDGVKVCVYPLPNSHCKGALAMMVDDEYLFLGDATYCMTKNGVPVYNAQLLKDEIELLKRLPAKYCLISHDKRFVREKRVLLRQLESIYAKRRQDSPYIEV